MGSTKIVPMARTSNARYFVNLIQAGMDGVISARKATGLPAVSMKPVWMPAAVGAALGAWTASLGRGRKSGKGAAVGGLVGSAVGLGCGIAWVSRSFMGAVARRTIHKIDGVRDARWLEENPITYA